MSEFGGRADVQQIPLLALVMITVLPSSARRRPLATNKNGDPKATADDIVVPGYAFLRRATPTRPIRPEPKSQRAGGTGTVEIVKSANKSVLANTEAPANRINW
jgi:hypothetical protein